MDASRTESISPPPGVIGSLRAGFDTIATHISAILLPVVLDLWLWLGPRVGVTEFVRSLETIMVQYWNTAGVTPEQFKATMDSYREFLTVMDSFNLAALLRTFPIGIPSLMTGIQPVDTPMGAPVVHQVGTFIDVLGWSALLTGIGWLGGYYYFRWVASLVVKNAKPDGSQPGGAFLQSLIISLIWAALFFLVGLPVMMVLYLASAVPPLQFSLMLFLGFLSMWLVVPLFFSPLGIFVRRQHVFSSILSGVQLARFTLPGSSLFVLCILLISMGLNFVWSIPPAGSWMSLVGILGHAFISTALLAASFIYYRDMTDWLQAVLERIKAGAATPQT
jgi:hypothetical protein